MQDAGRASGVGGGDVVAVGCAVPMRNAQQAASASAATALVGLVAGGWCCLGLSAKSTIFYLLLSTGHRQGPSQIAAPNHSPLSSILGHPQPPLRR
jgi:hypothetical protein